MPKNIGLFYRKYNCVSSANEWSDSGCILSFFSSSVTYPAMGMSPLLPEEHCRDRYYLDLVSE